MRHRAAWTPDLTAGFHIPLLSNSFAKELQLKCLMKLAFPPYAHVCVCVFACMGPILISFFCYAILAKRVPKGQHLHTHTHSHAHAEQHGTWKSSKSNLQHMDYIVQIQLALKAK